jgi:hypothetical protein
MGMSSSCEPPDDARFICVGTGSGLRIFLYERVRYEDWSRCIRLGYARVELRLGVFRTRRSRPVIDASASAAPGRGIGGGLERRGVGRCDDAGVVPGVDDGGRVELYVSADEGMSESVSVGDRWRSSVDQSAKDIHRGFAGRQIPKTFVSRGGETRVWSRMRSLRLAIAGRLLQNLRESGASRVLDHLLHFFRLSLR